MTDFEVLSPVGNIDNFYIAVEAGADAVYLGLSKFNARMKANNINVDNLFEVRADLPFSCSVTPYTSRQIFMAKHDFELKENPFVNVCLDLSMCGIGSASCGTKLIEKYKTKKTGANTFKLNF